MASRFLVIPVPDINRDPVAAKRVIDQNFHALRDLLNRAILDGTIVADGTITEAHLSAAAKALVGDVTGTVGASGGTTVVRIRGKTVDAPGAPEDARVLAYNHANNDFDWVDVLRDILTTRGDLVVRGVSAEQRLPIGGANTILRSDGTDPGYATLTALLDAVFSNVQGSVLYRGAANWAALGPGVSGQFLKTQGAGANPIWDTAGGGGGGGGTATTIEVNLGATARFRGSFTITDAAIVPTSKILCWQAPGPYTGKGTRADEAEMQPVNIISVEPATGTATALWQTPPGFVAEPIVPSGRRDSPSTVVGFDPRYPYQNVRWRRVGLVRGNVKFAYTIF